MKDLRENYTLGGLSEHEAATDPLRQFAAWFDEALAAGIREANAMALATVSGDGVPSVRMVLLKGVDTGFVFFTNLESPKARDMESNPRASLCFHWKELERQVRISGHIEMTSRSEAETYFHSRPRGSQLGAWASRQSKVLSGREEIESNLKEMEGRFADGDVPLPDFWGGYRLIPKAIEFWQGRPSRLHDRLLYTLEDDGGWTRGRLSP